ncbi:MAG: hypothetical protein WC481_07220 [Candidatus Omnitrophota bacterium]
MKKVLIIIAAVLIAVFLAKDFVASMIFTSGIRAFTDLPASVKSMKVGIFKSAVDIGGFKVYNPKNAFKDRVMLDMPVIYVDYDAGSFFTGANHLKKMKLELKELYVIKNEGGELNLDSLKAIRAKGTGEKGARKDMKFRIDELELKIGKVIYKDYTKGATPYEKEFNIALDERYENIDNPYTFASLVMFKALANTSIASLTNFDVGSLKDSAAGALSTATKAATDAAAKATDAVKKATEGLKGILPGNK